jgi:hypothetical protein
LFALKAIFSYYSKISFIKIPNAQVIELLDTPLGPSAIYSKFTTNHSAPKATTGDLIPIAIASDVLCVVKGFEDVDEVDPAFAAVFVDDTVLLDADVVVVVELIVVLLTRNQSAATGAPNPVSSTKFVRLKPIRVSTEAPGAVRFLKKATKLAGTAKLAGSL